VDDFYRDQGEDPQHAVELFPAWRFAAAVAPPEPLAPQLGHLPPQLREHAIVAGDPAVGVLRSCGTLLSFLKRFDSAASFCRCSNDFLSIRSRIYGTEFSFPNSSIVLAVDD